MNILAVVAHPDDEILGCGATLKKLANQGHRVTACVLCAPADARFNRPDLDRLNRTAAGAAKLAGIDEIIRFEFKNIQFNTVPHIEMVQAIESAILQVRPEWIFTHHPNDLNIDHRVCYETTMAAAALPLRMSSDLPVTQLKRILLFEVLSSTDWAPPFGDAFRPNLFVDVRDTLEDKLRALEAFEGAMKPFPHSRSLENVTNLARLRGAQIG
ncbi:MAG: PIG-L deacetylase family protein, partial [Thermoanaerobaculia bacterium]